MNPLSIETANFMVAIDNDRRQIGCAQLRPIVGNAVLELASVVVTEPNRRRGVGSKVVQALLQEGGQNSDVVLLTLSQTAPFYAGLGFVAMDPKDAPLALRFEAAAGAAVISWAKPGTRLVIMQRPKGADSPPA
jgi:N-acetylglutamate synthase-like GNAT family acetyltransferase